MNTKKILSIFLIAAMLIVLVIPSVSASNSEIAYEPLPQLKEGYNRYFFLVPEDWFNEHTDSIGIYWWDGSEKPDSWPGYKARIADTKNVYYYDVPTDVTNIIWNNYLDGGSNSENPMRQYAKQTTNVISEYYTEGDSNLYPEGIPSFNNMIYVTGPEFADPNSFPADKAYGEWFYYYGEGKYGATPEEHKEPECNRYYFLMPDEWYTEYTDNAGVYWWEGTNALSNWPGVKANKADSENVYYYDVPKDVTTIIWNNYLDLLMEDKENVMHLDYHTVNITMSSPDECDGMIYVIDPKLTTEKPFDNKKVYEGHWYKYLGNGEYETIDILGDANEDNKLNIKDATIIQKHLANMLNLSDRGIKLADFNNSGDINIKDATAIQKHLAGIAE